MVDLRWLVGLDCDLATIIDGAVAGHLPVPAFLTIVVNLSFIAAGDGVAVFRYHTSTQH